MKDDEKLILLADYVKTNTKLPVDVEEFLRECAARADSWGGYLPYKPKDTPKDRHHAHQEMADVGETLGPRFREILNNFDEEYNE